MMLVALWLCASGSLLAQTFTTVFSFNGSNGSIPLGLVQATDGNLYGTTQALDGTIFKITPSGTLTTLFTFNGLNNDSGAVPAAGLVQGTDGNFYGTTSEGGANGDGTVFKITPGGTLTTLHSFDFTDGEAPLAALVQGTDGNLYGTTEYGGAISCVDESGINIGCGTIFKITPSGTLTTLHSFDKTDGSGPGGLVQGTDGNFYGTTIQGGANGACNDGTVGSGCGTVFKITPGGTLTTLSNFSNYPTDGISPLAGLIQATDGNFYGTNSSGGVNFDGTVFKITPSGTLTALHSFDATDGDGPAAALVQATDGNFYGTTLGGGANSYGTVFQMTPSGTLTTLHSFDNSDGRNPNALIQDTSGTLYGTTARGASTIGKYHRCSGVCGTVFSVSVDLSPFVKAHPGSGKVGAAINILGTDLTGATSVTFNGTAAKFTVVSSSKITTTVPTGATTGEVQVVTPSGTLLSNVSFRVP
jgi:uncharacterized repeat protein (TIGR03803 family)